MHLCIVKKFSNEGTKDVEHMRNGLLDYLEQQKGGVFRKNEIPFRLFKYV